MEGDIFFPFEGHISTVSDECGLGHLTHIFTISEEKPNTSSEIEF